jgi:hypothetical protein
MKGQVRQTSCLNLMLSMHPFPQTNFFPKLMLVMTALLVRSNYISYYFDCYYNCVFMLSVGSSLVLQNVGKASPLSNLSEAGDDGTPG